MSATIRRVEFNDLSQRDVDAWRELARSACEPNPNLEPDYVVPFFLADPAAKAAIQFVEIDGSLVLCALVASEARPFGPLSYRVFSTSSDFGEREMARTHPLVSADLPNQALGAWFDLLPAVGGPSIVWIRELFADGTLARAIETVTRERGIPTLTHGHGYSPYVYANTWAPGTPESAASPFTASHLSKKARHELRRSVRLVAEMCGAEPMWTDRSAEPEAIDDFIALQASGWKGQASRGGKAFELLESRTRALHQVADTYRASQRLLVGTLTAAGKVLYMAVALRSESGVWTTPFDAYDEAYSHSGVGRVGRVALFNQLALQWPTSDIDPSTRATDRTVLGLFPTKRPVVGTLVAAGGLKDRAVVRLVAARERFS